MKRLLLPIFLATCFFSNAQKHEALINIGFLDSLYSPTLKETRKLWIYVPETDTTRFSEKFPVVYLLDGQAFFHSVADYVVYLSERRKCPKMIIVGIPNETMQNRTRDLTTSHVTSKGADSLDLKLSGGAENFTTFLEKELMPYIEQQYPASTNRTLIGHSDGGQFAINALVNHLTFLIIT